MSVLIVIPTLNAAAGLGALLKQCADETVFVTDGGSDDPTLMTAAQARAHIISGRSGRGYQLRRGVDWALAQTSADWILVLHADCILPDDWKPHVKDHITHHGHSAAYFTFGANARGWRPRFMEFVVTLRDIWPRLPYGDQGLLISREMYGAVGGYPDQVLFEDVEIIRAIKRTFGRRALRRMPARIMTDVSAYERDGFAKRTWRNLMIIRDYNRGASIEALTARYKKPS